MHKFEILTSGKQQFSEEDLYNLNQSNVCDAILSIRTHEGKSVILKGSVVIKLIEAQNTVKYNSAK